jgi:hypothetical protein
MELCNLFDRAPWRRQRFCVRDAASLILPTTSVLSHKGVARCRELFDRFQGADSGSLRAAWPFSSPRPR